MNPNCGVSSMIIKDRVLSVSPGYKLANFPHVLESSCHLPVTEPILESQVLQPIFCYNRSHIHFITYYWTRMYPMALMFLLPLSGLCVALFPHVLESSRHPPVPNPILELQEPQSFCWLPTIPILALEKSTYLHIALKPSLLQLNCKEACEPISDFHVSRPSEVARCCSSAISEYRESAVLFMTIKFVFSWPWVFIPRQILEKGVFQ